jgi:hypothetical protein
MLYNFLAKNFLLSVVASTNYLTLLAEFESDCGKMPDEPFEIIIFQIYDF